MLHYMGGSRTRISIKSAGRVVLLAGLSTLASQAMTHTLGRKKKEWGSAVPYDPPPDPCLRTALSYMHAGKPFMTIMQYREWQLLGIRNLLASLDQLPDALQKLNENKHIQFGCSDTDGFMAKIFHH